MPESFLSRIVAIRRVAKDAKAAKKARVRRVAKDAEDAKETNMNYKVAGNSVKDGIE